MKVKSTIKCNTMLIVHGNRVYCNCIKREALSIPGIKDVVIANKGDDVFALLRSGTIRILAIDVCAMPGEQKAELMQIMEANPLLAVIVLNTLVHNPAKCNGCAMACNGYLCEEDREKDIHYGIERVMDGYTFFLGLRNYQNTVVPAVTSEPKKFQPDATGLRIIYEVFCGGTNEELAGRMNLSFPAFDKKLYELTANLGVVGKKALAALAVPNNWDKDPRIKSI